MSGFVNLSLLLTMLINNTDNIQSIFDLIFSGELSLPDGVNNNIFQQNIKKIAECFSNDNNITLDKLKNIKNIDTPTLMNIVNVSMLSVQLIGNIQTIQISIQQEIVLAYNLLVYAILVPIAETNNEFREWLKNDQNKTILIQGLEIIQNALKTSKVVNNLVTEIGSSSCWQSCWSGCKPVANKKE
jgi:hypothetical protein